MTRARLLLAAAVLGFLAGAATIATLDGGGNGGQTTVSPARLTTTAPEPQATSPPPTTTSPPPTTTTTPDPMLLVWTSGGLVPGLADAATAVDGVARVSMVRGDELSLVEVQGPDGSVVERYDDGWTLPLDVLAIDPAAHAPFVLPNDIGAVDGLGPGEGLLSATSAELRAAGPGAVLRFTAGEVTVVGVIDDLSAAGAELIVDRPTGLGLGVATDRYLLVAHDGDRDTVQRALDDAMARLGAPAPARYRAPGETTWLRHGDAVLPAAHVKERFGEFAVRDLAGRDVEIDPDWVAANIVETDLPIIGSVTCHRHTIVPLREALQSLVDDGISHLVDPTQFGGCFAPRRIGAGLPLSRHSWGIAVDINVGDNPRGSFDSQDARLVDAMRAAGFGWGGIWLVPDPAHYEAIDFP